MNKPEARIRTLLAALPHIAFDGWSEAVLARAAEEAGYGADAVVRLFPGGVEDAQGAFSTWATAEMLAGWESLPEKPPKIREKIACLVMLRLEALAPHREAFRRMRPSVRRVADTADAIWHAAGDTSTDFNWYTKRLLLGGVLAATTLYWLNDTSPNFAETRAFLARRIENVMWIQKAKAGLRSPFQRAL